MKTHPSFPKNAAPRLTTVDLIIALIILALVAALVVPHWQRAWRRAERARFLKDVRVMDAAVASYVAGRPANDF